MLYSNHGMGTFYDIVHILQLGMYQQWVVHPMPSQRKTDYCKNISWGYIPVYTNLCIYIYAIMEQKQQTQANAAREISTVAKIVSMSKYGHPRKTRQNSLSVITWPFIYCNPPVPRFVQCRHKMSGHHSHPKMSGMVKPLQELPSYCRLGKRSRPLRPLPGSCQDC